MKVKQSLSLWMVRTLIITSVVYVVTILLHSSTDRHSDILHIGFKHTVCNVEHYMGGMYNGKSFFFNYSLLNCVGISKQ